MEDMEHIVVYRSLLLGKVCKFTSMDGFKRGSIARGSIDHQWHFVVSVFFGSRKRHLYQSRKLVT